uniref:Uncharacterized protein n=1 Tax=Medicago truncatula TaxID=3880 RepID=I3S382_MEDTR|nr:unknown [Medicago truncatula]
MERLLWIHCSMVNIRIEVLVRIQVLELRGQVIKSLQTLLRQVSSLLDSLYKEMNG